MITDFVCPTDAYDCPYFHRGMCMMLPMTGDAPEGQCDEYDFYNGDEEEEDEE